MAAPQAAILIVDDEELNRDGLARSLQRHDYEVAVAKSGPEAIEVLGDGRFDLVLLDLMMPGMNGLEVLNFLRRVDSLVDLPIIMVTARGESEDMVEALERGANDYITKPLDMPVVLARIRTQLALRRSVAQVMELEKKLANHNQELQSATEALAAANDRHNRDLAAAARVQQAFLPATPPEVPGARVVWSLKPCRLLAGDSLNVLRLGDRHAGLCVLDVAGHGVAAALLSAFLSQLIAQAASEASIKVVPPAKVAARIARKLTPEATAGHTISLLYGVLALDSGEFRFVSAGHPGPVHLTAGKPPEKLEVTGFPLGVGEGGYKEQTVALKPGDRLVLYSGGLPGARNAEGEHFGIRRLLATLEEGRRLPLVDALGELDQAVEGWRGDVPRQDDISVLLVERREATS